MFTDETYSTKVYMNTGDINGLTETSINNGPTADLADVVQPIIYLDLDRLTDFYIGNGVLATLTYTYSNTSYGFETNEEDVKNLKLAYDKGLARYKNVVKNCDSTMAADPSQQLATEEDGTTSDKTWHDWLHAAYDEYIAKIAEYKQK